MRWGLRCCASIFVGTGMSAGTHDRGRGERGDVTAALDFLAEEFPKTPLLVAGFSFGCFVGLRAGCKDDRVTECIGLGTPVNNTDFSFLQECAKPKLFVHGELDEFGDVKKVEALVKSLPGEKELVVVPGVDHFFAGKLKEVDAAITDWMMERHQGLDENIRGEGIHGEGDGVGRSIFASERSEGALCVVRSESGRERTRRVHHVSERGSASGIRSCRFSRRPPTIFR